MGTKVAVYSQLYVAARQCIQRCLHTHHFLSTAGQEEYPYTSQLLPMENCRRRERKHDIPAEWYQVVTPVCLAYWKTELASHPNSSFASWLCNGFSRGFSIGFSEDAPELRSSRSNMLSATEHPQVVSDYLAKELNSEHLLLANSSAEGLT